MKNKYLKNLEENYNNQVNKRKETIKSEPNKIKRFFKRIWFWISFPFVWIFYNIRDWRTAIIFSLVFVILSSEVWCPYLIGVICWENEALRHTMFGAGSACWLFWAGPGTPFLVICITITIGIKALFDKFHKNS